MNTGSDEVEIAGPTGKTLPGRAAVTAASPLKPDQAEGLNQLASKFALEPLAGQTKAVSDLEAVAPVNQTARIDAAERLKSVISNEVSLLKSSGAGSLAVLLRPDAETEVFVQLTRHNGQVEAFVRLEKGDAAEFRQNWERLQSSLADQQIKLLPLQTSDFSSRQERGGQHDGNVFQDREQLFQQPSGFDRRNGGQPRGRELEPVMPEPVLSEAQGRSRSAGSRSRALDSWA